MIEEVKLHEIKVDERKGVGKEMKRRKKEDRSETTRKQGPTKRAPDGQNAWQQERKANIEKMGKEMITKDKRQVQPERCPICFLASCFTPHCNCLVGNTSHNRQSDSTPSYHTHNILSSLNIPRPHNTTPFPTPTSPTPSPSPLSPAQTRPDPTATRASPPSSSAAGYHTSSSP